MATVPPKSPSVSGIEQRLERVESAVQKQTADMERLLYYQYYFFRFWYYAGMVIMVIVLAWMFWAMLGGFGAVSDTP